MPKEARLRVLHVINGLFSGGGHRSMAMLIRETGCIGDIRLCVMGGRSDSVFGVRPFVSLPYEGRYNRIDVILQTAARLRRVLTGDRFDIIHTHGYDADLIGALASLGTRTRHVSHLRIMPPARHSSGRRRAGRRLFHWLTRQKGTWFVAVSDAVRAAMCEYYALPPARVVTVRNGIDLEQFTPDDALVRNRSPQGAAIIVGTAARITAGKGLEELIRAVALIARAGASCRLRLAGEGSARAQLENLVRAEGAKSFVTFEGHVADMNTFYNQLDIFVLPSISEGLPLSVLEAMACGVPTISTAVGGIPEIIEHNVQGLLVQPGDVGGIADAISRLSSDRALRRRLRDAGLERVRSEFAIPRVAQGVRNAYRLALAS